jgi:hypothetical protein
MAIKRIVIWGSALLLTAGLFGLGADYLSGGQGLRAYTRALRGGPSPALRLAAPAADSLVIPQDRARLAEQFETVRLGLVAAAAGQNNRVGARTNHAAWPGLGLLAAGAGLIGAGLGIAIAVSWKRRRGPKPATEPVRELHRRRSAPAPQTAPDPAGTPTHLLNRANPILHALRGRPLMTVAPAASFAPRGDPLERRMQVIEGSVLQLLAAVEGMATHGPTTRPPTPPSTTQHDPPPSAEAPASTVDGRSLGRIRRAVLRLAHEGWSADRIASRLRLGPGDVNLILKSASRQVRRAALDQRGPGYVAALASEGSGWKTARGEVSILERAGAEIEAK